MPKKILYAEDDKAISMIMVYRLKEEGYELDHVVDGEQALEKMAENKYDLILLDLMMPKTDGFSVLEKIKAEGIKTPVLVFSNLSQKEDESEAIKLGAKEFFVKSNFSIDQVVSTIKKYI